MLFDDDRVVVAPLARAHPASAGGVGEGTLACGPTRAAADVLHDELLCECTLIGVRSTVLRYVLHAYFAMYSIVYSVLQNAPCTLLGMACTLMGRVEYIVLWLYSECTFGAQRGLRKVQPEYTSCAEYNVNYVKYM